MALNTCKMWSNGIKIAFFHKITKNCAAAGSFTPRPPLVIRLSYTISLNTSLNLDVFTF